MVALRFTSDPVSFLRLAGDHLALDPVRNTVLATNAERSAQEQAEGLPRPLDRPWWFLTVHDGPSESGDDLGDRVVGLAMRTAPFQPYPCWVQDLPEDAAVRLARELYERDEFLGGVNGALPAARLVAEETARLWSGRARIGEHTRLFELGTLRPPAGVPGRLRPADPAELDLLHGWRVGFQASAAEQAGRGPVGPSEIDPDDTRRRIRDQKLWVWEDGGRVVHLSGINPPSAGVARIGPVYTPPEHRGNGYAAAAVAAISALLLNQGARVCLFTDQANPVSNRVYEAIGYRPVVDMVNLLLR
jgi:RimJ/RimL family protein N-acetyltransferase